MHDNNQNSWSRRSVIKGIGATAASMAVSACGINNANRTPQGLSEAALAIKPVVDSRTLEKPNITVGYVPVNDCAPFAVAWEKGLFRKYGLNVTLSREAIAILNGS